MTTGQLITVTGNISSEVELRTTASGAAVLNITVANTQRLYDRQAGEWKDGDTLFLRCNMWRQLAENAAESLVKGARVIVTGTLKQRSFENKEGQKVTVVELEVDEIGPSLRYATAKVTRTARANGDAPAAAPASAPAASTSAVSDPWSTPAQDSGAPF